MTFINRVSMSNAVEQKILLDSGLLFWHWTKMTLPDGRGVMVHNQPVRPGDYVLVDDDLVLFLIKSKHDNA